MIRNGWLNGLFLGVLVLGTMGGSAQVAKAAELIVRFNEPQNTKAQALRSAFLQGAQGGTDVKVLNEEEGLVKIDFDSNEGALRAKELLERSPSVVSVAPNFAYQKALHLRMREVTREDHRFFALPLFGAIRAFDVQPNALAPLPEVQLPGTQKDGPDALLAQDWSYKNIRLDRVPDLRADTNLITAVIDTGVDYNHEDLIAAMWRKPGSSGKEVGYDFAQNNAQPFDRVFFDLEGCMKDFACQMGLNSEKYLVNPGHGTHCAGHVGAVANNTLGIRGAGAGTKIMALKFFYDAGHPKAGQGDDAAAIQTIDYAIKNGVKVISASWGGRQPRDEAEKSELKQALVRAQKAGVLFIVAAGNDGVNQDTEKQPSYPAAYDLDNIITVAASDVNDKLGSFSNYGPKSVHIAAPGVKIFSTTSGGKYSDIVAKFKNPNTGKEQTMDWDGTSMATPIVAGAAALIWSKYPHEDYKQIRDRILKSARKVAGLTGKVATGGVLDVAAALGN